MKSEKFMHYMMCGHGRCFSALESNKEKFREIVLYGCLNDITFDLQCEGSRGLFMYNLALQYDDFHYFLDSAIEKFLSPSVDCDWHLISHLCDFISLFADDYGDKSAEKALSEKYAQIYEHLMSVRWSAKANEILQCYEYISIVMAQKGDISRTLGIIEDMGKFFIRRRRADDDDLKWRFAWFWYCAREEYGSEILEKSLDGFCGKSAGVRRFRRVMNCLEEKSFSAENRQISAEDFI
ncbi:MAG: hypothetical protein K2J08_05665, partial [Ruminococcus sp.]|nr:hypothetical protein [Ruminococcus sp.]